MTKRGFPARQQVVGCAGAPFASPRKLSNGRWVMKAAVGSILHDNCCLKNPNGKWCGKYSEFGHDSNCDKEWNKAVWNTQPSDKRTWEVEFDPKAAADLTPVNNPRRSVFARNYQNGGTWSGPEVAASRKLAAPKGNESPCRRSSVLRQRQSDRAAKQFR